MEYNPKYMIYQDLIGIHGLVKPASKQVQFKDFGMVIDDTRNMLITEKNKTVKKFVKKDYIFRFNVPNSNNMLEVTGHKIVGRPENRLRNLKKKRWFKK